MRVGVIAGKGDLPRLLIQALQQQESLYHVLAFRGETDPETPLGTDHLWVSLGEMGKTLRFLKDKGVSRLVMAGKFQRPSFKNLKVDGKGALWIGQLLTKGPLGDDKLLQFLAKKLGEEGFQILAPQDILQPLLGTVGLLTPSEPTAEAWADIRQGLHALKTLSILDMGQAIVVQRGVILGVEGAEGTDQLIQRCGVLQKEGSGAVLVKGAKEQQDLRLDPPVIGPETIRQACAAGFQGIAFMAQRTLILHPSEIVTRAEGLFVVGVKVKD